MKTVAVHNETFRATLFPSPRHKIIFSEMVADLSHEKLQELLTLVRQFKNFNEDNDPYGERDFGSVLLDQQKYYFKIDYYDEKFQYGADPAEGPVSRILTIMHSSEY